MSARLGRWWPAAALCLLAVAPCVGAFRSGSVLSASSLLRHAPPWARGHAYTAPPIDEVGSDRAHQFEPWLIWSAAEVRAGRWPLWNPHAYCGMPFVGSMQTAVFSPFNALAYVLPMPRALALAAALKMAVAGLGMIVFLQLLGVEGLPAFLGAVAFMRCGFVMCWLGWSLGQVAVWMPWIFAATERLRLGRRTRDAAWLAAAVCVQWLGGHPETSFHLLLAAAAFATWRAAEEGNWRFLAAWGAAVALGTTGAGLQLLPLGETLRESATLALRGGRGVFQVLERESFILFFIPDFYGSRADGTAWEQWFSTNYNEISGFVGLVPWLLVPCALMGRDRRARVFSVMALLALGTVYQVPVIPRLVARLPGLSLTVNIRFLLVADFALAVLAALGAGAVEGSPRALRARMAAAVPWAAAAIAAGVLACLGAHREVLAWIAAGRLVSPRVFVTVLLLTVGALCLRWWLLRPAARLAPAGLVALQLWGGFRFATGTLTTMPTADVYPATPAVEWLSARAPLARAVTAGPNLGGVYGWREVSGYNAMNPRRVSLLITDRAHLGIRGNEFPLFTTSWDGPVPRLLNVGYVLRAPGEPGPGISWHRAYTGPDAVIWSPRVLPPRAWIVGQARSAPDEEAERAWLVGGRVDPAREVLLPAGAVRAGAGSGGGFQGRAHVTEETASSIDVAVDTPADGWLVLAEAWAPGWRAELDGSRTTVWRADHAIRAVRTPAGRHRVRFRYDPASFKLGMLVTGLSIGAMLALALGGPGPGPAHAGDMMAGVPG